MAKKKKPDKEVLRAIEKGIVREEQKEQGALDGRFRSKVVPSKKKYKRKPKNDRDK